MSKNCICYIKSGEICPDVAENVVALAPLALQSCDGGCEAILAAEAGLKSTRRVDNG